MPNPRHFLALRCILIGLKLSPRKRILFIDIIPVILDEAAIQCLGTIVDGTLRALFELMTGIRPLCAFINFMRDLKRPPSWHIIEIRTAKRLANIAALSLSLADLPKDVLKPVDASHKRVIDDYKQAKDISTSKVDICDFVVICKPYKPFINLAFFWTGPRRVIFVKRPAVCVVQDLDMCKEDTLLALEFASMMG